MRFESSTDVADDQSAFQVRGEDSQLNNANGTVYLLWFVPEGEDGEDDALVLGVYASGTDAKAAIHRLQDKPGFSDHVEGFQIHSYEVGRDHWTEGFVRD